MALERARRGASLMRAKGILSCATATLLFGVGGAAGADFATPAARSDVESLRETIDPPRQTLAQQLRHQLDRLEAENDRAIRDSKRRVDEAELSLRGNRPDLDSYRRRELAREDSDELMEDLERRLVAGELRGSVARGELEGVLHRTELSRNIDRVLRRITFERRLRELDRTQRRREASGLGLHRSMPGLRLTR
jgi:hypothetical protein